MQEHDQGEDEFGFGQVSSAAKERIRQIKPSACGAVGDRRGRGQPGICEPRGSAAAGRV